MKHLLFALAAALILPPAAVAQGFPARPVRMVVPYPAGGTTDLMARALQEPMQKSLGQPVVVENKPGASGIIAAREVARAAPDGHTLLFINSGIVAVTPFVVKDAGFDGVRDFAPVALVSTAPLMVVVNPSVPATDLKGFLDHVKQQPNPVPFASAGTGSFGHLASELLARTAGLKMTHVPYKGQAPTTNAIVAGEVQMLITTASAAMNGFIANGKLRLLAVTSPEPSPLAPGAPTVASVLPGYAAETWFGFLTTAGTPADAVGKLNDAVNRALESPEMQKRFSGFGVLARTATPARVGAMIAEDVARWSAVVRENNIRAD
ncbi:MAG: tripartite tricarboxylate transporter substrate binding protein [Burkholderiales bacterium]|nr:tripartite tricarboxylate transporter substrate binding protein [Burkholderiales bacterium]